MLDEWAGPPGTGRGQVERLDDPVAAGPDVNPEPVERPLQALVVPIIRLTAELGAERRPRNWQTGSETLFTSYTGWPQQSRSASRRCNRCLTTRRSAARRAMVVRCTRVKAGNSAAW